MGWIKAALLKGELKITENRNCPFCNPEHRTNVKTKINAHKEHKWVNKTWYENTFKNKQWIQHNADTSEVEFYVSASEPFKKLRLPVIETESGGVCSFNGKHYLYVTEKKIENIEFYVHEFTELIIKDIIINELEPLLNKLSNEERYEERAHMNQAIGDIAHCLSQENEGDKIW